MSVSRVGSVLATLIAVACSDAAKKPGGETANSPPILAATSTGSKTDCLTTGLWAECSVLMRLERAGLVVRAESLAEVREPALTIAGKRLPIARGEVAMFIYADTSSRSRDQRKLDPTLFMTPDAQPSLVKRRTLIANQNLLVLMDVVNETNRERIANALMAGPPQPPKHAP